MCECVLSLSRMSQTFTHLSALILVAINRKCETNKTILTKPDDLDYAHIKTDCALCRHLRCTRADSPSTHVSYMQHIVFLHDCSTTHTTLRMLEASPTMWGMRDESKFFVEPLFPIVLFEMILIENAVWSVKKFLKNNKEP